MTNPAAPTVLQICHAMADEMPAPGLLRWLRDNPIAGFGEVLALGVTEHDHVERIRCAIDALGDLSDPVVTSAELSPLGAHFELRIR